MGSNLKILREAGFIKMPLAASHLSHKVRLYYFYHQDCDEIRKIQKILESTLLDVGYPEITSENIQKIKEKPCLLKLGKTFELLSKKDAFQLKKFPSISLQEKREFYEHSLKIVIELKDLICEGEIYNSLGNVYYKMGEYDHALTYYKFFLLGSLELKDREGEGRAYGNLGTIYKELGNDEEAIIYYEKDLKIALELGDQAGQGVTCCNLGHLYHELGDDEEAIIYYEKALTAALELKDRIEEGAAYSNLGNSYEELGDDEKAIMYHQKALTVALELKDELKEGVVCDDLGNIYRKLGNYQTAITYYEKELKISLAFKDFEGEGRAYGNLGITYQELGNYPTAITYHEKDLKICLELKDLEGEGSAYGNLGIASEQLGDYRSAITYQEKALKIALELGDRLREGRAYCNLANVYQGLGDYKKAIIYHEKDLKIALELEDLQGEGGAYNNLGTTYHELGDYRKAITFYEKALEIILELKNHSREEGVYGNLGNAYEELGDYRTAITYHKKHLKIAVALQDLVGEGKAYGNLGNAYEGLKDYQSAITYHEKHLKIAVALKDLVGEGKAYGHLGNAYEGLKDYQSAIIYHEKDLKIAVALKNLVGEGKAYGNLGNAYDGFRDYRSAIMYHEKDLKIALELGDVAGEGQIYGNLGAAYYGLKSYKEAITSYEKSLKIALELKDRLREGRAYSNLGIAYYELEENSRAEDYFRQSIKISALVHHQMQKAKWQIAFFEEGSQSYRGLEDVLLKQDKHFEALEASDQRRAPALSFLISKKLLQVDRLKAPLEALTLDQMFLLAKKLHTTFIIYSSLFIHQKEPSIQAWVMSFERKKIKFMNLPISGEFFNREHIFKAFPYQMQSHYPTRGKKLPSQLFNEKLSVWYRDLIAPLDKYLPSKESGQTVTFVVDEFLAHLPFGAFYNQTQDKYLIENYPISVAPSIGVLSLLDQLPQEAVIKPLLLGNPTTAQKEMDELKYAEKEVCEILAPLLGIAQEEVLIQERATPTCILNHASSAGIIHIACHGVAGQKPLEKPDPNSVFEGLFKLAPDDQHLMGHLHARDIALMNLKADLVFMSACHLGRGNLKREGSIGPVWSFLGAGAKSTIASYWPLPEGDTTVKMVDTFYRHYLGIDAPKLSKAKALQQAVLMAMKTERDKPRQWGAFFLSGLS
ncbi:MAG: tetratricopeptide repeat protein [Candidatus Rhabdochlamydia sp.]